MDWTLAAKRGSGVERESVRTGHRARRSLFRLYQRAVTFAWCAVLAILAVIHSPLAAAANCGNVHAGATLTAPCLMRVARTLEVAPAVNDTVAGVAVTVVPDVRGFHLAPAIEMLRRDHLVYAPFDEPAGQQYEDQIVRQDPAPGTRVRWNTVVRLTRPAVAAQMVTVPPLIGLTLPAARARLESVGLSPEFSGPNMKGSVSTVISQDPQAGTQARPGSPVTVGVQTQVVPVIVPNVIGLTTADATAALAQRGLTATLTDDSGSSRIIDKVVRQFPSAGARVAPATTTVQLTRQLATSPTGLVEVPGVIGQDLNLARERVEGAGLVFVPNVSGSPTEATRVTRQRPNGGAKLRRGASVEVDTTTPSSLPWGLSTGEIVAIAGGTGVFGLLWFTARRSTGGGSGHKPTKSKPPESKPFTYKPPVNKPPAKGPSTSKPFICHVALIKSAGGHAVRSKDPGLACPAVAVRLDWPSPGATALRPADPTRPAGG